MRICFTSDLHGRLPLYDQLTELVRAQQPEVLILGGDMHADVDAPTAPARQLGFVEQELLPRVRLWREMARGLDVLCVLGNHDAAFTQTRLAQADEAGELVLLLPNRSRAVRGIAFLGMHLTPPTPYWLKDFERLDRPGDALPSEGGVVWDAARQTLRDVKPAEHFGRHPTLADALAELPIPGEPWVFVCHAPPAESKLDRLPHAPGCVGSQAVREFLERHNPRCALHGHVHESLAVAGAYADEIADTLCINPGQSHETLHAVCFSLEKPAATLRHTLAD
jgi:Icc-related predicted phosphoesterase